MYDLPSQKYFAYTAVPKLYSQVRESVVQELKGMEYFSATADMYVHMW